LVEWRRPPALRPDDVTSVEPMTVVAAAVATSGFSASCVDLSSVEDDELSGLTRLTLSAGTTFQPCSKVKRKNQ